MTKTIAIQPDHIDEILDGYAKAIDILQKMKTYLEDVRTSYRFNYSGMADEIYPECIAKFIEQVEFIELCCSANKAFIETASDALTKTDKDVGKSFALDNVQFKKWEV